MTNRRVISLLVTATMVMAITLVYGLLRTSDGPAEGPQLIRAIHSPGGRNSIELVVHEAENADGTFTFGIKGTTLEFTGAPWSAKPHELVQWVNEDSYLLNGQVLVNHATQETNDPLMLPCSHVALSTALSPDRTTLAAEVLNQEAGQIQVWLSQFDGNPRMVFSAPVSTRFGEAYACANWGSADSLYFDYSDDKTSYVYRWSSSSGSTLILTGASRPIPSADGRLLGVISWNDDGRPSGGIVVDAQSMKALRTDLPEGWLTWMSGDRFSVHLKDQLHLGRVGDNTPISTYKVSGRIVDIAEEEAGVTVKALAPEQSNGSTTVGKLTQTTYPKK